METMKWYPANYSGFGVTESRIYVTPAGQVLAVLAEDVDPNRADPIVLACGLKPVGNGGTCWCVAPLLEDPGAEAPFPNACFATVEQVEDYLRVWASDDVMPLVPAPPIGEDEFYQFVRFLDDSNFELPVV